MQSFPQAGDKSVKINGTIISFQQTWSPEQKETGIDFVPLGSVKIDLLIDGDRYPRMVYLDSTPRIKVDRVRIESAEGEKFGPVPSVLDITPTVLTLFGLPTAKDMDGRSWDEVLLPKVIENRSMLDVASYESLPRDLPSPSMIRNESVDEEQLKKLQALGYIGLSPSPTQTPTP